MYCPSNTLRTWACVATANGFDHILFSAMKSRKIVILITPEPGEHAPGRVGPVEQADVVAAEVPLGVNPGDRQQMGAGDIRRPLALGNGLGDDGTEEDGELIAVADFVGNVVE